MIEDNSNNGNKEKALAAALSQIERQFGKESGTTVNHCDNAKAGNKSI